MNVLFAFPEGVRMQPWEDFFLTEIRAHFREHPESAYRLVEDPALAEIIVLLESNAFRSQHDIASLERQGLIRDYPEKVFTINYEDHPAGFLPGLYAALSVKRYDPQRHAAWCYLFPPNPEVYRVAPVALDEAHALLFSFRGAPSHECRERLFALKLPTVTFVRVTRIDRWYDHTRDEQQDYVAEIVRSRFVLCPRGLAPASHRLFEVMALGRCPVIIGDEWVPPEAVDWERCSIRVAEQDIGGLPELLDRRAGEAAELGRQARQVWEQFFSPERRFEAALDAIVRLRDRRPAGYDERAHQKRWRSYRFYRLNGWALDQRLARAAGKAWRRIASR